MVLVISTIFKPFSAIIRVYNISLNTFKSRTALQCHVGKLIFSFCNNNFRWDLSYIGLTPLLYTMKFQIESDISYMKIGPRV